MNKVTVGKSQTRPSTYSIGMIGRRNGGTYILSSFGFDQVGLISIVDGCRCGPGKVFRLTAITQEEMDRIAPGFEPLAPGTEVTIEVGS